MPSLLDEVKSHATKAGAKCAICTWLKKLDKADADSWREVFAAPIDEAQHTAIVAYMESKGLDFTIHQVTNHRREHAWKNREQA